LLHEIFEAADTGLITGAAARWITLLAGTAEQLSQNIFKPTATTAAAGLGLR
jgi:hypothetical protein